MNAAEFFRMVKFTEIELFTWGLFLTGGHKYRDLVLQVGGWTQG
jgi:hypothetical protein